MDEHDHRRDCHHGNRREAVAANFGFHQDRVVDLGRGVPVEHMGIPLAFIDDVTSCFRPFFSADGFNFDLDGHQFVFLPDLADFSQEKLGRGSGSGMCDDGDLFGGFPGRDRLGRDASKANSQGRREKT